MNGRGICIDFRERRAIYGRYFEDSKFVTVKNGYEIEIIEYPNRKFIEPALKARMSDELGQVLLKDFGKSRGEGEELIEGNKIMELTANAHYLLIGRKDSVPVSFHSGILINPLLYYSKATFVEPVHQHSALGAISTYLTLHLLLSKCNGDDLRWVTRTRNYMVARMVKSESVDFGISTEKDLDEKSRRIFRETAEFLNNYMDDDGVVKNVYLTGIPQGPRSKDERIQNAMDILGPQDACYIVGIPNLRRICFILDRCIVNEPDEQKRLRCVA
jgi:hypothetical protein